MCGLCPGKNLYKKMQDMKPDLDTLNAYVDGELSKDDAADVARAVACDPTVARKVATLANLRSTLSDALDVPELTIDELVSGGSKDVSAQSGKPGHATWVAVAACLAGLAITGIFLHKDGNMRPDLYVWTTPVLEAHELWQVPDTDGDMALLQPVSFLSKELVKLVYVPDLTSARLRLTYVNPDYHIDGTDYFVAGYTGTRGCKITLVAQFAQGNLDAGIHGIKNSKLRAFAWNAGPLDYVLMSQGMDIDRFELIAETVRESSLSHHPVSPQMRVALGISRELSAPCNA